MGFWRPGRSEIVIVARNLTKTSVVVAAVACLLLPADAAAGIVYSVTDLGLLPGGGAAAASGISSNGYATGSGDTAAAASRPFLWSPGAGISSVGESWLAFGTGVNSSGVVVGYQYAEDFSAYRAFTGDTLLPTLGGGNNAAMGINNAGAVVGYSDTATGAEQAFLFFGGTAVALGALAVGGSSRANAINSSGNIAGQFDAGDGLLHPALYTNGAWVGLDIPSEFDSGYASAISDAGHVAGAFTSASGRSMGFLRSGSGSVILLGSLSPDGNSRAEGVNSGGIVVGASDGDAFLYDGAVHDLNALLVGSPGWVLTDASAINDAGQIAGTGYRDGAQHAFLLNPENDVPEPASVALVLGGLLAALTCLRKEKKS